VETASDGQSAVEMALSRRYDLLLMDVQMPVLDGLDATRAIRARAGRTLPIIAMTANAFGEDRAACLAAGMNDHVGKPVNPARLHATLLRWLPLPPPLPGEPGSATGDHSVPPPDVSARVQQRLSALEGFDLAHALRHVGGRPDVLFRVLQRFVDTYRQGVPELLRAGTADEQAAWAPACHGLRGACATIGAAALQQRIAQFEAALRQPDAAPGLAEEARALNVQLLQLVDRLAEALDG
jgi:two-component system, sensor histidine kinase and response regulator